MLVCKKATRWQLKNPQSNDKLYKKQCCPVITENKKHSSKQVAPITYTLEKSFFAITSFLLLLKIHELFLFKQIEKVCSIRWSVSVLFAFLEKKIPNKYCL